jgi:hypothetical protein
MRGDRRRAECVAPSSRCLTAAGVRFLGHPVPARGLGLPRSRLTAQSPERTPSGFPRSTQLRYDRDGRPLYPGDGGVLPVGGSLSDRHPPLLSGQSLHSAEDFRLAEPKRDEASPRVHSRSPVRSSPCLWPPDGSGTLGRLLRAPHPTVASDARRSGDGPWTLARIYTVDISRTSNRCNHSNCATSCRTDPAFPGRSRAATGSPVPPGPWSTKPISE